MNKIPSKKEITDIAQVVNLVYSIRNQRVMLDQDLAQLYGVETRVVNQQVKRNINKFDEDFMFRLTDEEFSTLKSQNLKSQNVISSWGGRRYPPYAFTEKGVIMLANVVRSKTADDVSKHVVRTFTEVNRILKENRQLKQQIEKLEKEAADQNKVIQTLYHVLAEIKRK
jgi:phage regulator Rha-like protein